MSQTQPVTFRIPRELLKRLDAVCRWSDRSRSRQIVHFIRTGLHGEYGTEGGPSSASPHKVAQSSSTTNP